jgi:cytochrome c553
LEGKLIYDRTLLPGSGSSTYGLEVAKAMGLPFTFMERAYTIRNEIGGERAVQSSWNSEIYRKQCELCGTTLASDLEVHHIEHREHGGSNKPRNLAVVCKSCHHKHHDEGVEIPPLQQTSDGAERISVASSLKHSVKTQRSDDEMKIISATLQQFKGRPPERITAALQEEGIYLKAAELKRYMKVN